MAASTKSPATPVQKRNRGFMALSLDWVIAILGHGPV